MKLFSLATIGGYSGANFLCPASHQSLGYNGEKLRTAWSKQKRHECDHSSDGAVFNEGGSRLHLSGQQA